MQSKDQTKWMSQFDLLRLIAALAVVCLHASAHIWYYAPTHSADWLITHSFNVLSRIGVPLFVMISGAMFLDSSRLIPPKKLWLSNILRLVIVYVIWSCVYGFMHYLDLDPADQSIKALIKQMLLGNYHLWFLPMLIGLYAIVPLLRKWVIAASKPELNYVLALFFIFQILRVTAKTLVKTPEVIELMDKVDFDVVCGYAGYFLLGYYLYHVGISEICNKLLYVLFPVFLFADVAISTWLTWHFGELQSEFQDSFGLFTFLMVISVFQFITRRTLKTPSEKSVKTLKFLSKGTFGLYLVHLLIMDSPWIIPLYSSLPPLVSIPLITVISFALGLLIATILRCIPLIGKYLC